MKPLVVGAAAPAAGGAAGGAIFTPCAGSTGKGPDGAGGTPAPPVAARPPPRPPPLAAPALRGVDHSNTVLNFGPSVSSNSLPLYISRIVARPFASRIRSLNTSSIRA